MAMSTVAIHILDDVPSSPLVGILQNAANSIETSVVAAENVARLILSRSSSQVKSSSSNLKSSSPDADDLHSDLNAQKVIRRVLEYFAFAAKVRSALLSLKHMRVGLLVASQCVSLPSIPSGTWYCKYCENMFQKENFVEHNANAVAAGRITGIDPLEQITKRCIHIVETTETDVGISLIYQFLSLLINIDITGDTFPLGCAFDESIVHHKYFEYNLDSKNSTYSTKNGIYSEGCGLDNVMISWGMTITCIWYVVNVIWIFIFQVAKEHGTTLPPAALFIIRYHSFYPLHKSGAYTHLMNADDVENLKWLKIFNKYDLYSKNKVRIDVEKVKPYYLSLIEKVSTTLVRKLGV
ncbi:hypothetical protein HYC85_026275 [Camellia sinensis]|uniref:Inositol oxygenase n=1 Tax=Camellia sinensis TaxID=4442 RepID=A0A7J7G764_CAMSI|nr:hypothetical protein HYC85_026275 [Camellia sinensis]